MYTVGPNQPHSSLKVSDEEIKPLKICVACRYSISLEDLSISTSKKEYHWGCASWYI
jgi:hypothetical protein